MKTVVLSLGQVVNLGARSVKLTSITLHITSAQHLKTYLLSTGGLLVLFSKFIYDIHKAIRINSEIYS